MDSENIAQQLVLRGLFPFLAWWLSTRKVTLTQPGLEEEAAVEMLEPQSSAGVG